MTEVLHGVERSDADFLASGSNRRIEVAARRRAAGARERRAAQNRFASYHLAFVGLAFGGRDRLDGFDAIFE